MVLGFFIFVILVLQVVGLVKTAEVRRQINLLLPDGMPADAQERVAVPVAEPAWGPAPQPVPVSPPVPEPVTAAPMPEPAAPIPVTAAPIPEPAAPIPEPAAPIPEPAEPIPEPAEPVVPHLGTWGKPVELILETAPPTPRRDGRSSPALSPSGFELNENFLGRNILPLIAGVLGLIGLVFLGVLVVPKLSDPIKIALMFVISVAVGVLGYALHRRARSVLTQALIGTGVGGLFISILVTHLYFHRLNDIAAFTLLAVWIVASIWLSRHTNSLVVAVLAHIGMVVSIVSGFGWGLSDDKLVLLLVYQIVATVAIIAGNAWWVRAMYRFGLFVSQAMIIWTVFAMWHRFMGTGIGFASDLPPAVFVAAFLVQFLGATAVAYLLFVSCARVKDPVFTVALGVLNATMWATVLVGAIAMLLGKLAANALQLTSSAVWTDPRTITWALITSLVLAILPAIVLALAGRGLPLRIHLEVATLVPLAVVGAGLLIARAVAADAHGGVVCPWIVALTVVYLGLGALTRSRAHTWVGWGLLGLDAIVMLAIGYPWLTQHWTPWSALGYLVVLMGLAYAATRQIDPEWRRAHLNGATLAAFGWFEISLGVICMQSLFTAWGTYGVGLFLLATVLVLVVVHFFSGAGWTPFYRTVEMLMALFAGLQVWRDAQSLAQGYGDSRIELVLTTLALCALVVVFVNRIRQAARAVSLAARTPGAPAPQLAIEVMSGFGMTFSIVGILTGYGWFLGYADNAGWGYPMSLSGLFASLLIVSLGLWSRIKPLRLFGLVVVILCVLKLVTFDIGNVTPIARVVAFLGGAAVCFGISALYHYTAKHFDKELAREISLDPPIGLGLAGQAGQDVDQRGHEDRAEQVRQEGVRQRDAAHLG